MNFYNAVAGKLIQTVDNALRSVEKYQAMKNITQDICKCKFILTCQCHQLNIKIESENESEARDSHRP